MLPGQCIACSGPLPPPCNAGARACRAVQGRRACKAGAAQRGGACRVPVDVVLKAVLLLQLALGHQVAKVLRGGGAGRDGGRGGAGGAGTLQETRVRKAARWRAPG